jgi:uncharacterized protein YihD (DUF1040 family)
MPGLRLDESPHAIRRRFSESSDLPLMPRLIKLYRESGYQKGSGNRDSPKASVGNTV